jgi:hypothetical protein
MNRYCHLMAKELKAAASDEISQSKQVEMLMMHFSGAPSGQAAQRATLGPIIEQLQRVFQKPGQTNSYGAVGFVWIEQHMKLSPGRAVGWIASRNFEN